MGTRNLFVSVSCVLQEMWNQRTESLEQEKISVAQTTEDLFSLLFRLSVENIS